MTQEQKEFLIKDISARIPYGLKGRDKHFDDVYLYDTVIGITFDSNENDYLINYETTNPGSYIQIDEFKPIPFPLSAITNPIITNGLPNDIISYSEYILKHSEQLKSLKKYSEELPENVCAINEIIDLYNRYHIDYRNLIGQGLALSAYDFENNPYN